MRDDHPTVLKVDIERFARGARPWGFVVHRSDRPGFPDRSGPRFASSRAAERAGKRFASTVGDIPSLRENPAAALNQGTA